MGIFNYNNLSNTLDAATDSSAKDNQIATAGWVISKISAHSPTGNCATGQTSSASTTSSASSTNTSAINRG
jgi:hypothetical protein